MAAKGDRGALRGTFVHPEAALITRNDLMREPVGDDDPDLRRRVADYLAAQNDQFRRFHNARTPAERLQIIDEIVDHAQQHRDLTDEMAHYQSDHGNPAGDPSILHPHPAIDLTPAKSTTKPRKTATTSKTTATSNASATPRTASTRRKADGTTNG